jgi:hypothetical protein
MKREEKRKPDRTRETNKNNTQREQRREGSAALVLSC